MINFSKAPVAFWPQSSWEPTSLFTIQGPPFGCLPFSLLPLPLKHTVSSLFSAQTTLALTSQIEKKKDSWKLLLSEIEIRSFLFPSIISSNLFLFNYIWAIDFCMLKLCPAMWLNHLFVSSSCSIDLSVFQIVISSINRGSFISLSSSCMPLLAFWFFLVVGAGLVQDSTCFFFIVIYLQYNVKSRWK